MDQWTSKLKKLLHIEKQPQNSLLSHHNHLFKESPQKQQSNFKFTIPTFFQKTNQQTTSNQSDLSKDQNDTQLTQRYQIPNQEVQKVKQNLYHQQESPRTEPTLIQIITETQQVEIKPVYKFTQQNVNKSPNKIYDQMDQQDHQSDEDSLGYTENDWDQQTINFQLEDRMLDCLEDQKHANQYRQSLAQSSLMRKRNEQRLSKPERPPSPKQNQLDQLDFQKIVQQFNPNSQPLTVTNSLNSIRQEKKPTKPQRRNRFSKYKKQSETNPIQQKSLFPHFSPEEEQKLDQIFKKKAQQFQTEGNQTCDDYIARVFNLKNHENLNSNKEKNIQNEEKHKIETVSQNQELKKCEEMKKKLSSHSQESFEAVEEIKHLNLSEIDKKESEKASQQMDIKKNENQNQLQNKQSNQKQIENIKNKEIFPQEQKQQVLLVETNQNQQTKDQPQNQQNIINEENEMINKCRVLSPLKSIFNHSSQKQQSNHPQSLIQQSEKQHLKINEQHIIAQNKVQKNLTQDSSSQIQEATQNIPQKNNKIYLRPRIEKRLPIIYNSPIVKGQKDIQNPYKKSIVQQSNPQSFGVKPSPEPIRFQTSKTPRAKIQFNYVNLQQKTDIKLGFQNQVQQPNMTPKVIIISQPKFERQIGKKSSIVSNLQAQSEERIPIFLQRLRRLISTYPNFYLYDVNLQKIRSDLKIILNSMKSAISVIQLLFKKMKIQRNKLHQPFIKINRCKILAKIQPLEVEKLNNEIWDFFMNSGWENSQIEEIQFIQPKQKFKMRTLNPLKVEEGLKMYKEFINVYLNQSFLITQSPDEIKRYIRIRQKISEIIQYLRMMSEDLYTYWLVDCHYPYIYYEYLQFLKQNNQPNHSKCDQIYAKLIGAQQYNDPLSLSIIGTKIIQKVQQTINSA